MAKNKETKKEKKAKSGERKLYMLECISIHKIRYCVETDEKGIALIQKKNDDDGWDWGQFNDLVEFSQDHAGERMIAIQPIPDKETYLKMFNSDNQYLKSWSDEKKFEFVNKK